MTATFFNFHVIACVAILFFNLLYNEEAILFICPWSDFAPRLLC